MTAMGAQEVSLINCTQDDLYVEVGTALVLLTRQSAPNAVAATRTSSPLLVRTSEGGTGVVIETFSGAAVTLNCPERKNGTLYVVTPDVLAQFPHRDDFVAVSAYRFGEIPVEGDTAETTQIIVIDRLMNSLAVAEPDSVNFVGTLTS